MSDSLRNYINYKDSLLNNKLIQLKDSLQLKQQLSTSFLGIPEDWWTHIILPVAIPLIAFLLLWLRDKRKELKDLKAKQNFLFTWIDLIAEPIKKQTAAYISFASQLKELEISKDGLGKYNLSIEKLQYYNSEQLVNLFVKTRKGNKEELSTQLFTFENSVDFIKRKQDFVTSIFEELKLIYGETSRKWNENFYELRNIFHKMSTDYGNGYGNKRVEEILKLHSEYTQQKEDGMKAAMNKFINVVGPIANEDINQFPTNMQMRELIECLVQLKNIYESRKKHFEEIARLLNEAAEKMNENFLKIEEVKINLKEKPFKNLLFI